MYQFGYVLKFLFFCDSFFIFVDITSTVYNMYIHTGYGIHVDQNIQKKIHVRKFSRVCYTFKVHLYPIFLKELLFAVQAHDHHRSHLGFFLFVFVFELSVLNIFFFRTSTVGTFVPGTVNGLANFHLCRV